MSMDHDHDFLGPMDKSPAMYAPGERPNSKLAVTSLVFGILGVTALPLLGSIVAIATGHAAMGEIRESGGRLNGKALAKVGLSLGYFEIVLALIAAVVVLALVGFVAPVAVQITQDAATEMPHLASGELARGVKMVNEMSREDFQVFEDGGIDVKQDEIVACYNAGKPKSDPEFALLTTQKLIYLKDGRKTVFDLKDVVQIKDDFGYEQAYNVQKMPNGNTVANYDYNIYHIEVQTKQGPRMRIDIQPEKDGTIFYNAISTNLKNLGVSINPTQAF